MFELLTVRAREMFLLAQEEARRLDHKWIGTEHLLLGLLREEACEEGGALSSFGVTLGNAREQVESIIGYGTGEEAPFTVGSGKTLDRALSEARERGHDYVGPDHLLLSLLSDREGVATRILSNLGVDSDKVRHEVVGRLGGEATALRAETDGREQLVSFRARVEGLLVHVRCGVSEEERALPQALQVDLDYSYEAEAADDLAGTADYGALVEGVAELLEREEFKLLETGVRRIGDHVLNEFSAVAEVTVSVTKLKVPVARTLSGVSVSATFRR